MELSRFTDYSMRILIYAGVQEKRVTVREIADRFDLSLHHLNKVANHLSKLGYVTSTRGRGGGLHLSRHPSHINVGGVIRQTEQFSLVDCLSETGLHCAIDGACLLKQALQRARNAFLAELDRYTLADLLGPKRQLAKILTG